MHDTNRRFLRLSTRASLPFTAAMPLLQVGGCTATEFREVLINELTSQVTTLVFTAVETVLLNLFNV